MAKLLVMYAKPNDVTHFTRYFRQKHIPLVKKLPGLRSCTFGLVGQVGDAQQSSFFWVFEGIYDSIDSIQRSHESPEGKAVMADIPNFSPSMPTQMSVDVVED